MNKKDMRMYLQMFSPSKIGSAVKSSFSHEDYALCYIEGSTSRTWVAIRELPDNAEVVAVEVTIKSMQ